MAGTPILIVVSGLPATGKSTVASALVRQTGFAYLRVDRIEQAIIRSASLQPPLGPVGYLVAYEVAAEQLRNGVSMVAECVNPLGVTRDAWRTCSTPCCGSQAPHAAHAPRARPRPRRRDATSSR